MSKLYKQSLENKYFFRLMDIFKLKDWELIGIPYLIIVGRRANEGIVELKNRYTNVKEEMPYLDAIKFIEEKVKEIK